MDNALRNYLLEEEADILFWERLHGLSPGDRPLEIIKIFTSEIAESLTPANIKIVTGRYWEAFCLALLGKQLVGANPIQDERLVAPAMEFYRIIVDCEEKAAIDIQKSLLDLVTSLWCTMHGEACLNFEDIFEFLMDTMVTRKDEIGGAVVLGAIKRGDQQCPVGRVARALDQIRAKQESLRPDSRVSDEQFVRLDKLYRLLLVGWVRTLDSRRAQLAHGVVSSFPGALSRAEVKAAVDLAGKVAEMGAVARDIIEVICNRELLHDIDWRVVEIDLLGEEVTIVGDLSGDRDDFVDSMDKILEAARVLVVTFPSYRPTVHLCVRQKDGEGRETSAAISIPE